MHSETLGQVLSVSHYWTAAESNRASEGEEPRIATGTRPIFAYWVVSVSVTVNCRVCAQRRSSAAEYRTDRPRRIHGIWPPAVSVHSVRCEIARALAASRGRSRIGVVDGMVGIGATPLLVGHTTRPYTPMLVSGLDQRRTLAACPNSQETAQKSRGSQGQENFHCVR